MSDPGKDLNFALERLRSDDLQTRVEPVEALTHLANRLIDPVIEEFARPGKARWLIFERLGRFGSLVIEPLEQLLERADDQELRVLTAAALLSLGSDVGVPVLLDSVHPGEPLVCVVVRILVDAQIHDDAGAIEDALYSCDLSQTSVLV